jgi:hypothetical protein
VDWFQESQYATDKAPTSHGPTHCWQSYAHVLPAVSMIPTQSKGIPCQPQLQPHAAKSRPIKYVSNQATWNILAYLDQIFYIKSTLPLELPNTITYYNNVSIILSHTFLDPVSFDNSAAHAFAVSSRFTALPARPLSRRQRCQNLVWYHACLRVG